MMKIYKAGKPMSRQAHEQKSFQREAFVFLNGLVFKALNSEAHCKPMALTIRCI
jgi:hypothetical protein